MGFGVQNTHRSIHQLVSLHPYRFHRLASNASHFSCSSNTRSAAGAGICFGSVALPLVFVVLLNPSFLRERGASGSQTPPVLRQLADVTAAFWVLSSEG